jgi:hypothetical protein
MKSKRKKTRKGERKRISLGKNGRSLSSNLSTTPMAKEELGLLSETTREI